MKIFKMLDLLYNDAAYYDEVVNIFKDEISDQSLNNLQVVLNKYLNTLKVFGIKVHKESNKFVLDNSLFSLEYTPDDLKSISILLNTVENFPDKDISSNINDFIQNLILRMGAEDRISLDNFRGDYDFTFYHSDLKKQIEECKKICKENHVINILYKKNKKQISLRCIPKEIIYDSKTAYLSLLNKDERLEIPLPSILSIVSSPQVAARHEVANTVVFKLKNRLAKTYKLKENEYLQGQDENGNLIVVNKGETSDKLLSRLKRYSYNCEIISPKTLKNQMISLINETLKKYGE